MNVGNRQVVVPGWRRSCARFVGARTSTLPSIRHSPNQPKLKGRDFQHGVSANRVESRQRSAAREDRVDLLVAAVQ